MRKESFSPRERWEAVLKGQRPDRLPMDYWATPGGYRAADETPELQQHRGTIPEVAY